MLDLAVATHEAPTITRANTDAELIRLWLFGKAIRTQAKYRADYGRFHALTGRTLRDTTLEDMQAFVESLTAQGGSGATVSGIVAAVKSLFSFAHRVGYIPFNVGAAVPLPKVPDTLTERILTEGDTLAMIRLEANTRNRAILSTLYYGGLRVSELCGLQWKHIGSNTEGAAAITVHGKGGKTRHVAIPAHILDTLDAIRGEGVNDSPVFVSRQGGSLDQSQVNRIVSAAARRAGIIARVSPHWLRHAHASHAIDNQCPISVVRDTLGHASLATTSRYVHAKPTDGAGMYLKY